MGARNIRRLWQEAFSQGDQLDLASGDVLELKPEVDDQGSLNIGDGTTDMDVKVFLGGTGVYALFDVGDGHLQLSDDTDLSLGTGNDVKLNWNGTYVEGAAASNAMWDDCPVDINPDGLADFYELKDDFFELDTTATVGKWTNDASGTGTVTLTANTAGGSVSLTPQATTDNAAEQLTLVSAPFYLAAGKTLWYETRLRITGDVQSEHAFGLVALGEDLTGVADVKPQDGVAFTDQDGSLALTLTASKNGTNTGESAGVHTLVSTTWVTIGFKIDGVTSVTPYVDGVVGTAITATIPDDLALAPFFLTRNGDATTTQIMEVDYVRVVQLR